MQTKGPSVKLAKPTSKPNAPAPIPRVGFRKVVVCKRCGLTTTYTNDVEYNLWELRHGCPACYKRKGESEEPDAEHIEPSMHISDVVEWVDKELSALNELLGMGIVNADEYETLNAEIRHGARVALGLESIGDDA